MKRVFWIILLSCIVFNACGQIDNNKTDAVIWDSLEFKMLHSDTLSNSDWNYLFKNIHAITDDISEGLGNGLFNHLKQNEKSSRTVLNILNTYSKEKKQEIVLSLIELMSIDIVLEGYNSYYDFTVDFPVFSNNLAAKDLYYYIIENNSDV